MNNTNLVSFASVAMGLFLASCGGSAPKTDNEVAAADSVVASDVASLQLPVDAKKAAEGFGIVAYIQPVGNGEMAAINAVWVTDDKGGNAMRICLSNENSPKEYAWKGDGQRCLTKDILAADEVHVVKDSQKNDLYLVVSGCPDMRNIYSYLISIDIKSLKQETCSNGELACLHIPASENYEGYDEKNNTIAFYTYGYYEEGGRYRVKVNYDFNGKLISKGEPENE